MMLVQRQGRHGHGFTLIEVLVTIVLVSIAVVGVMGGIRAIGAASAKARNADLLQRLASEKLNDLKLLSEPGAGASAGDFSDRGYSDVSWSLTVEASGAADVDKVTVTASRGSDSQALTTLIFVRSSGGLTAGAPLP